MKLRIDTALKQIQIEEKVNLGELFTKLEQLLPNDLWKEYSIEVVVLNNWINPIIIDRPYPVYPTQPFWHNPYVITSQISPYNAGVTNMSQTLCTYDIQF